MGRTVVDIPYSDCANTVWRGQYFWRKNFYLAIMLSKAENRGGGHQRDGSKAPGSQQQHQNIWYLGNLHFDWPYRSHWKLFVLSAGCVTFPAAGSCCAWCITSSTLNNQHQGRQSLAFVTMAIGKGGITPVFFFAHFLRCPCFRPMFRPFVPG